MSKCRPVHQKMSPSKQKFLILGDKTRRKLTGSTEIKIDNEAISRVNLIAKTYKQRFHCYNGRATFTSVVDWGPLRYTKINCHVCKDVAVKFESRNLGSGGLAHRKNFRFVCSRASKNAPLQDRRKLQFMHLNYDQTSKCTLVLHISRFCKLYN